MLTPTSNLSLREHTWPEGVSICIPAFNEQETIERSIISASETLGKIGVPGEILVIDDCSQDKSWEIIVRLTASVPQLQIRRHEVNEGIAATFSELYSWAGKALVFLNSADGQWEMAVLHDLLMSARDFDLVVGSRRNKCYGTTRKFISWAFNQLAFLLFRVRTYDAGSVKLVRREIYDIPIKSSGVFGEAERIIKASRRGYRITVMEVEHRPRVAGKARGAMPGLVLEGVVDVVRCWVQIVLLKRY
jgi:glycosyltransferase involved in cell wall biosynthesis